VTVDWGRLDHDRLEEAVAAYVLDALDGKERAQLAAHVEGCPSCRALMWRLSRAVNGLPMSVADVRPPERLRERIMAAAAVTPPVQEEVGQAAPRIIALPVSPSPEVPTVEAFRTRRNRPLAVAYAAAAAVLAAGLAVLAAFVFNLNNQLQHAKQPPSVYYLQGTGSMAGASGKVTVFVNQDVALVSLNGLPQLASSQVYQLWVIEPSKGPVSVGVFAPDRFGSYTLKLDRALKTGTTIAVTQEDGPQGAPQPTRQPELSGTVTS